MFKMGTKTSERVRVSWLVMIKLFSEEDTSKSVYKKSTSQFFFHTSAINKLQTRSSTVQKAVHTLPYSIKNKTLKMNLKCLEKKKKRLAELSNRFKGSSTRTKNEPPPKIRQGVAENHLKTSSGLGEEPKSIQ